MQCGCLLLEAKAAVSGKNNLFVQLIKNIFMKRKKLIISILVGAAVAGTAFYLFGTKSGQKEVGRLKKTGSVTAETFKALGKEVERNLKQERKHERNEALKAFVEEALVAQA